MDKNNLYNIYGRLIDLGFIIHGTNASFKQFDSSKIIGGSRSKEGFGFYFTDTPYKCIEYGTTAKLIKKDKFNFIELSDRINKSYLYMDIFMDMNRLQNEMNVARTYRSYEAIEKEYDELEAKYNELGGDYFTYLDDALPNSQNYGNLQFYVRNPNFMLPKIASSLVDHGVDGFHNENVYVVFNFEKLNSNLYDINDPEIESLLNDDTQDHIKNIVGESIDKFLNTRK